MSRLPVLRLPPSVPSVAQSGSTVGGNQVAGNYSETNNYYGAQRAASVVDQLLARLQAEIEAEVHCSEVLVRLQRFHGGVAKDGIRGLQAKLEHVNRGHQIEDAMERKESFAKLLETWSLYASAQEIFVHLLAKAEHLFNSEILPEIGTMSEIEVNRRMNDLIVNPTVAECGASLFQIDHYVAMGMVYWLAEQCFVRWH